MAIRKKKKLLYCSFCRRSQDDVQTLIVGQDVNICHGCAHTCMLILAEKGEFYFGALISKVEGMKPLTDFIPNRKGMTLGEFLHKLFGCATQHEMLVWRLNVLQVKKAHVEAEIQRVTEQIEAPRKLDT